ncbi:MAG: hypothetical protein ACFB00_09480 [Parvularculaceae bacterium]
MQKLSIALAALGLGLAGCQSTGEGALYGAALGAAGGAVAGEVFAGRPGRGAAYGSLIGAAVGAYEGCSNSVTCFGRARYHGRRHYDRGARRHYYEDPYYGDTYWDDGRVRHRDRRRNRRRRY